MELDADYDPELLRSVSILKISDEEAELLVDGYDERALGRLGVPEVVVTLGSRGCIVYADGVAELVRAHAVQSADPTGAGDAFATAYLAARSGGAAHPRRRAGALVRTWPAGRMRFMRPGEGTGEPRGSPLRGVPARRGIAEDRAT